MRLPSTAAAVMLVLVAGCGGHVIDTPSERHASPSPDIDPDDLPPGVSPAGDIDEEALLEAHRSRLAGETYRFHYAVTTNGSGARAAWPRSNRTVAVSPDRVLVVERRGSPRFASPTAPFRAFSADNHTAMVVETDSDDLARYRYLTDRDEVGPARGAPAGVWYQLGAVLDDLEMRVTGTVTRDGRTLYRFESTGVATPTASPTPTTPSPTTGLVSTPTSQGTRAPTESPTSRRAEIEVSLLVSESGVIHEFHATRVDRGKEVVKTTMAFRLERSASPPERPDWLVDVPQVRASPAADGRMVVLEHTGGASLPANATLTVVGSNETTTLHARGRLPESLEPGETAYVWVEGTGKDATLRVVVGDRPDSLEGATDLSDLSPRVFHHSSRYILELELPDEEA